MPESGLSGSARGAASNGRPYREPDAERVIRREKLLGQMFAWAGAPLATGKITIPVFAFDVFDLPDKPPGKRQFGLLTDNANNVPQGLKPGIVVPAWVPAPIEQQ